MSECWGISERLRGPRFGIPSGQCELFLDVDEHGEVRSWGQISVAF